MVLLRDKLSHLTYRQACKLLGPHQGERLIRSGGKYDIDIHGQVALKRDLFRLDLGEAVVTLNLDAGKKHRLNFSCSACARRCEHLGAAFRNVSIGTRTAT